MDEPEIRIGRERDACLVLYDGDRVAGFGDRLHAAPLSCLWSE